MSLPSYQELIPTVLRTLEAHDEAGMDEMESLAMQEFSLSDVEREALLPSGQQRVLRNRVGWAKWHLEDTGLVETIRRGRYRLTTKGRFALTDPQGAIAEVMGRRKERLQANRAAGAGAVDAMPQVALADATPEESIERAHQSIQQELAHQLLASIQLASPRFFEELVVKLLLKMGYGGSRQEAGEAVGRSGDGGIDGIINEDRLGLDAIYLQAKRWEGSVGEGPIRDFKGALDAKGAQKGVFITTSTFTPAAKDAARNSRSYRIVLIDGARLADLVIEHDLGVSVVVTYQLKRIDSDFFADQ